MEMVTIDDAMNNPKVTRFECVKPDWMRVVNAARRTWGKAPIDHEPSDKFKRKILLAEHSPIRLLEYDFTIENIRQWVTVHLVRHHEGCEKFVHTQRQDINEEIENIVSKVIEVLSNVGITNNGWRERDYLFQGQCNDMDMTCNSQAFINISRKRLCRCASPETRQAWEIVIAMLKEVDPILAEKCVPECVYRGFCPEHDRCCGYVNTSAYQRRLNEYRKFE
jgi:thymidylate synthase ThyX